MLMSLTILLRSMPPMDPRGTTSVVAIPTPSFGSGQNVPPIILWIARLEPLIIRRGHGLRRAKSAVCGGKEPVWEMEDGTRTHDSVLKNWAMLRNLLYRDTSNSAGGICFSAA